MKLTVIFLFAACLQVNASGYAQRITISQTNVSLKKIFKEIESQSGYHFFYKDKLLRQAGDVSIHVRDASVQETLDLCLKEQPLTYSILDKIIVIKEKKLQVVAETVPALPDLIVAPVNIITGTVKDAQGNSLAGVSVVVKGTTKGTSTSSNGSFSIDANVGDVLEFTIVGYQKKSVTVGQQTEVSVVLELAVSGLSDVVVVGYGTQKKSDLTGSVSSVKAEDIMRIPVTSVNQALQGRAAGVQVRQNEQQPGGGLSVRIRGISSVKGNTDPLYVIDGIVGGNVTTLNPEDIESLEILKDASSTAIFGANGSNGVVLITTKRGNPDKNTIGFNTYMSVQKVERKLDLLNPLEYAEIDVERRKLFGQEQVYDLNNLPAETDWQDLVFQSAPIQNYSLSASGGSKKVRYFTSANYINQQGVIVNTDYSRFNLRLNLDAEVNARVKIGTRIGLARDDRGLMNGEDALNKDSPASQALFLPPVLSPYDKDGKLLSEIEYATISPSVVGLMPNPLQYSKYLVDAEKSTTVDGTVFAEIQLLKELKFRPSFNFTLDAGKSNYYKSSIIFNNSDGYRNAAIVSSSDSYRWNTDMILSYGKSFAVNHRFDLLAGFIINKAHSENLGSTVMDFALDAFEYNNLSAGSTIKGVNTGLSEKQQLSYIGRANYSFKNKYLFSFSGRYDGSSVFGVDNRWGFFPSGAMAWKLSEEHFIREMNVFSDLKIRVSYGISGSDALSPYASQARLSSGQSYIINNAQVVGYWPRSLAVPDLQWEQTAQFDIGVDAAFFERRLEFTGDFYKKNTSKLFLNVPVPLTSGVTSVVKNTGTLENTGVEFGIKGIIIEKKFNWSSDLNFSFQRQKITSIGRASQILLNVGINKIGDAQIVKVGKPLGSFYGYASNGIWQTGDFANLATIPLQFGVEVKPGDQKFIDQNDDFNITSDDRKIIGHALPKFFGGWSNTFRYKGFDASLFFDFVYGNDILNVNRYTTMMTNSPYANKEKAFMNYWTPENASNTVPRLDYNQPNFVSDYLLEDGSYLRLRELTLGYSFLPSTLSTFKINRLRIYASATNLFILTKYSGYNPDVNTYGNNSGIFNVDFGSYPMYSTYLIGLNVEF